MIVRTTEDLIKRDRGGLRVQDFYINDYFAKLLPTTPFEVVQGISGKVLFPVWGYIKFNWFANYSNVDAGCYAGVSPVVDTEIDAKPFMTFVSFDADFLGSSKSMYSIGGTGVDGDSLITTAYDGLNATGLGLKLRCVNGAAGVFTGGDARNNIVGKIGYIAL